MSTVIKAGQSFKIAQRLTTIDLADYLAEAERIMHGARVQARSIVVDARQDAANAEAQGRAEGEVRGRVEGFEAGQAAGLAEAGERFDRELGSLQAAMGAAIVEFEAAKRNLLIAARHDVLEFAVALARRVVKRVVEIDRTAAAASLEEALRLVSGQSDVTVRVNPLDGESLRRFAAELAVRTAACPHLTLVDDPQVSPGGCILSTPTTRVNADIESQLDQIVRLLLGDARLAAVDGNAKTIEE